MNDFLAQWERNFGPLAHRIISLHKQKLAEDEKYTRNIINGRQHSHEMKLINSDMANVGYTLAKLLEDYQRVVAGNGVEVVNG